MAWCSSPPSAPARDAAAHARGDFGVARGGRHICGCGVAGCRWAVRWRLMDEHLRFATPEQKRQQHDADGDATIGHVEDGEVEEVRRDLEVDEVDDIAVRHAVDEVADSTTEDQAET